jgi:pyrroline-5-carboxylate reductase
MDELAGHITKDQLVVSVMAGITTAAISKALRVDGAVVRAMPNTPCLVDAGATAIAAGARAGERELKLAEAVFAAVGLVVTLPETALDAVTGLSGSGPAYVAIVIESLADGGVKMGHGRATAMVLATQTVLGSAKLILETGMHPGQLKDMVSSPGGTTIAGIAALEEGGVRRTFISAVERATQRSRELGKRS